MISVAAWTPVFMVPEIPGLISGGVSIQALFYVVSCLVLCGTVDVSDFLDTSALATYYGIRATYIMSNILFIIIMAWIPISSSCKVPLSLHNHI